MEWEGFFDVSALGLLLKPYFCGPRERPVGPFGILMLNAATQQANLDTDPGAFPPPILQPHRPRLQLPPPIWRRDAVRINRGAGVE